ncbi:MAG TPA: peroxiredoxin family protein [Gemmatimonadaceae bacterium]|jgi:peroxiredoxin Q/BCP
MLDRKSTLLAAALLAFAGTATAQAPAAEAGPKVGDVAPDFSLPGATMNGLTAKPVSLSQYKGQTVVVAFFPKSRTSGCTAQMTGYRDQWATLFNGGKGIAVIAISMDADTTQMDWAKEAKLPMTFASDMKGEAGKLYGAYTEGRPVENRLLYIVGPDGKIKWTAKPFKPMVADSYAELGTELKKVAGDK